MICVLQRVKLYVFESKIIDYSDTDKEFHTLLLSHFKSNMKCGYSLNLTNDFWFAEKRCPFMAWGSEYMFTSKNELHFPHYGVI